MDRTIRLLKDAIRERLEEVSNEIIGKKVAEFRDELIKNKNITITKIIDSIEFMAHQNQMNSNEINFIINIKGGKNG